ncbi:MAG TPA: DUF2231 domain-containing protein [Marmoricola sp.]|nr:DUF2231 domain-containing protein [Marmoricola sp.]
MESTGLLPELVHVRGLPLHPLVVHAVVVLVPLGALSAILHALVPRWRWLLRQPTLALALAAVVLARVAVVTGTSLKHEKNFTGELGDRIARHMHWGQRLEYSIWVYAVLAVLAWWVLPHVTRVAGGEDRESPAPRLVPVVMVLLPVAAAVVLVLAVITGDAGAQAVWHTS